MTKKTLFQQAEEIIHGPRRKAYGDPKISFDNIAIIWSVLLKDKILKALKVNSPIDPASPPSFPISITLNNFLKGSDVALMMVALKLLREKNAHHEDNLIDIMGYAGLVKELQNDEEKT